MIEDEEVIKKILKHLGLWEIKARPLPKATRLPKLQEYTIDYSHRGVGPYGPPEATSQLPEFTRLSRGLSAILLAGLISGLMLILNLPVHSTQASIQRFIRLWWAFPA